ncbi:MAG: hypothetical protein WD118_09240 [Phycisphaeraceae bacterium]
MSVIALIDGEHHPAVVRDALDRVAAEQDIAATLLVGGGEKIGRDVVGDPAAHYGREVTIPTGSVLAALRELASTAEAEAVLDLSGEPVLEPEQRMNVACVALESGLEYRNADTHLTPPQRQPLKSDTPVIEVIGTGKRTGKTAVCGHLGRILRADGRTPAIVSMGRGGPPEPQVVRADERPDLAGLLAIARGGGHAASDYLEDAVLAGVDTVGCRRCGEGLAGQAFQSNMLDGARLALSLEPSELLVEGSGACIPPLAADRTICVTSAPHAKAQALSYLGPLRVARADLLLLASADMVAADQLEGLKRDLSEWAPKARKIGIAFAPEPAQRLEPGTRVAVFTTAPPDASDGMRARLEQLDLEVKLFSTDLARRAELERHLSSAADRDCDVYLTELKAAAIDMVAEGAERVGARTVFLRNTPVALAGEGDLDEALLDVAVGARA